MITHCIFIFLWLISLSIQMVIFHSFKWLSNIPSYICITSSLSIHLLMDTGCFHILTTINNAAMTIGCMYLLEFVFSFSLAIYPEVQLLDHMVVLFLIFWRNSILLATMPEPVYIPTTNVQFSSVQSFSHVHLCDPMNRNTPGLPLHHQFSEFTQTHVHRVSDAIQPSHPLSSPSPPAPNPSQHQSLFQWVSSSHQVAEVLEFQLQHHSLQRNPRADLLQNGLVGSPCSPRDSQESSPTPQFKSISSLVLSFLHQ